MMGVEEEEENGRENKLWVARTRFSVNAERKEPFGDQLYLL